MVHLLFGFSGRINRAKWWLLLLAIVIINLVPVAINLGLGPPRELARAIGYAGSAVTLWVSLAAGAKRLHDLNRSGAWLVLLVGVPFVLAQVLKFLVLPQVLVFLAPSIMGYPTPSDAEV